MLRVSTLRFGWSFALPITFYLNPFGRGVPMSMLETEVPFLLKLLIAHKSGLRMSLPDLCSSGHIWYLGGAQALSQKIVAMRIHLF